MGRFISRETVRSIQTRANYNPYRRLRDQFGLNQDAEIEFTPTAQGTAHPKTGRRRSTPVDRVCGILDGICDVDDYLEGDQRKVITIGRRYQCPLRRFSIKAPHHTHLSTEWLRIASTEGNCSATSSMRSFPAFRPQEIITLSPINGDIAWEAGTRWMRYRRAGGSKRIITDFLMHSPFASAEAFLTRDRGFYAAYFPN